MNRPLPALLQVTIAVILVVVIFLFGLMFPSERASGESMIVGAEERVLLFDSSGEEREVLAAVNTATSDVSIDRQLVTDLGYDLSEAEIVTVLTPAGLEKRPLVKLTVQFAGERHTIFATVSDRTNLTTPLVIGKTVLGDVQVAVDQTQLTDPGEGRAPSTFEALIASTTNPIQAATLVALIPLAAAVMVALRQIIGLNTLGTFAPMLIAFSMLQVGIFSALAILLIAVLIGLLIEPLMRFQSAPRLSRLGILIGLTAAVIVILDLLFNPVADANALAMALPLIAIALVIERLYEGFDVDGIPKSIRTFVWTVAVSVAITALFLSPFIRFIADSMPISLALASVIWIWVLGSYQGLRLTELLRFRGAAQQVEVPNA